MEAKNKKQTLDDFYDRARQLAQVIETNQKEILSLLTAYETHDAAHDEIIRSIEALQGAEQEFNAIDNPHSNLNISTFFPLNLPLYSLILFGVMPSAFAKNVFIRPPQVMETVLDQLWGLLDIANTFPELSLKVVPRHIFVSLYASESDLIIFTGKYHNALAIHEKCPDSLLLYNGSGVNPFIVFDNADLTLALDKAVEMRCFNSGQDCAGPDVFFVAESITPQFIEGLKKRLDGIKVGETSDADTDVGPTVKPSYIAELVDWIEDTESDIVYGGQIDVKQQFVHPTVALSSLKNNKLHDFHEFFAPFFNVVSFADDDELQSVLNMKSFRDRGMYISVFGENKNIEQKLDFVKILKNCIVNDVEKGNHEYGGYGEKANFLLYGDQKITQPVLVSRDIHLMIPTE